MINNTGRCNFSAGEFFRVEEVKMKKGRKLIVSAFAILMFAGALAINASAQTGGRVVIRRVKVRPVAVRHYASPYWGYSNYWGDPYWGYSSFYNPYWNNPYLRYQEQKYYLQRELRSNQRELQKHQQKYSVDGYISPKERKELDDNISDVQKSRQKLREFNRNN